MENSVLIQGKLQNIVQGARWFEILGIVISVVGWVFVGLACLSLLKLLASGQWFEISIHAAETALAGLGYIIVGYLSRRAADAFTTIAAIIKELGEIV